jgi:hypothetical protein
MSRTYRLHNYFIHISSGVCYPIGMPECPAMWHVSPPLPGLSLQNENDNLLLPSSSGQVQAIAGRKQGLCWDDT